MFPPAAAGVNVCKRCQSGSGPPLLIRRAKFERTSLTFGSLSGGRTGAAGRAPGRRSRPRSPRLCQQGWVAASSGASALALGALPALVPGQHPTRNWRIAWLLPSLPVASHILWRRSPQRCDMAVQAWLSWPSTLVSGPALPCAAELLAAREADDDLEGRRPGGVLPLVACSLLMFAGGRSACGAPGAAELAR
jgi:hypothetical protein